MRAANLLVKTLVKAGIDKIFSLSGNQIMSIYDASISSGLEIIHARHEAGAVYMADGYARTSGKPGVALVTAAPGFGNALSPLYSAGHTRTPLLLLSGDSPVARDGMGAFQELDQPGISSKLTKRSWRIHHPENIADEIAGAIRLARSGRPGPVHVALPEDVLKSNGGRMGRVKDFSREPMPLEISDLRAVISHLNNADAPLIITGPSLAESRQPGLTARLEENLGIPVITMQSPRGINDPTLGKLRRVLKSVDSILLIDKEIDFTLDFADPGSVSAEKFVMIAGAAEKIAQANILAKGRLAWGCLADPLSAAEALCDHKFTVKHTKWRDRVLKAINERPAAFATARGFTSPAMVKALANHLERLSEPPLLIIDGGEIGQWAQAGLPTEMMHINGISGAIGGSIPQAIGAAFSNPGRRVIAILGDGTAGFHFMEIEIARRWKLPITFVIGNDRRWGAEVEIQKREYGSNRLIGCQLDDKTRYDTLATGLGANGVLVKTPASLKRALESAARKQGPTVINALITGRPAPSSK